MGLKEKEAEHLKSIEDFEKKLFDGVEDDIKKVLEEVEKNEKEETN